MFGVRKPVFEVKVLGLSAGQPPKVNIQQQKKLGSLVGKEEMDCFEMASNESLTQIPLKTFGES